MSDETTVYDTAATERLAEQDGYRLSKFQYYFYLKIKWLGRWFWLGPLLGGFGGGLGAALALDVLRNGVCR